MMKGLSYFVAFWMSLVLASAAALAQSSPPSPPTSPPPELQTPKAPLPAPEQGKQSSRDGQEHGLGYTVVQFPAMASQLPEEEKSKLRQVINSTGEKTEITVAVWSDKVWSPEAGEAGFTKEDKKLAEQRADAIKHFVKEHFPKRDKSIHIYTMTEKAGFLAKVFNTEESEIKAIFAKEAQTLGTQGTSGAAKGKKASKTPFEAMLIKEHGGPSKAVVVTKQKS